MQPDLQRTNGIPDSNTFWKVFKHLNPTALTECLYDWLPCHRPEGSVIVLDGKTICGSGNQCHRAYHVVSVFVAENQLTLGEVTMEEKNNEITAVPVLLELVDVKGSIVTADAMSRPKEMVRKIHEKEADYAIALRGNQPMILEDVAEYFQKFGSEQPMTHNLEKGHGRMENRAYCLATDLSWLSEQKK